MAKKITDLPAAAAAATSQLLEVVTDPGGSPVSQKLSILQVQTLFDARYLQSPVGATNGGTGQTTVTIGDLLYGSAANTWSKLAGVATGNALISGGVGTAPSWGKIGLTTHVSGILAVANGGSGAATWNAGSVFYGAGASPFGTSAGFTFNGTALTISPAGAVQVVLRVGNTNTFQEGGLTVGQGGSPDYCEIETGGTGNGQIVTRWIFHSHDTHPTRAGYMDFLESGGQVIYRWYTGDPGGSPNLLMELNSVGDLAVTGKLTATGGVDPPYMLFDLMTPALIKGFASKISQPKKGGAMVFLDSETMLLRAYVPGQDKFYNLSGQEVVVPEKL